MHDSIAGARDEIYFTISFYAYTTLPSINNIDFGLNIHTDSFEICAM